MLLQFKKTDAGLEPAHEPTGHFVVVDDRGRDTLANGECAKLLAGWDKAIGFEPPYPTVLVGPYWFEWRAPYWTLTEHSVLGALNEDYKFRREHGLSEPEDENTVADLYDLDWNTIMTEFRKKHPESRREQPLVPHTYLQMVEQINRDVAGSMGVPENMIPPVFEKLRPASVLIQDAYRLRLPAPQKEAA